MLSKRLGLVICLALVAIALPVTAWGTGAFDRLRNFVFIGDGTAATKTLAFDTTGSPNASVSSTSAQALNLVGSAFSAVNSGGDSRFTLGSSVAGGYSDLVLKGNVSATNWDIGSNIHTASGLEFTPSTAGGGTTFTTPTMMLLGSNVGIGSNSPSATLDVTGSFAVSGGSLQPYIDTSDSGSNKTNLTLTSNGSKYGTLQNESNGGTGAWSLGYQSAPSATIGTAVLTWTGSGNVGVGTGSPSQELHVFNGNFLVDNSGAGNSTSGLRLVAPIGSSQYNWMIGAQQNVGAAVEITPSTATGGTSFTTPTAVFTQTGRVGINSTSPATALDVVGAVTITGTGGNTTHACTRRSNTVGGSTNTQSCSGGEIVVGGGCADSGGNNLSQNFPNSTTSWGCTYSAGSTVTAYAICCSI